MKSTQLNKDDIEFLEIKNFKSIGSAQRVTFGALTVLSGANSTGKSTLMQPILLLKQTLDSPFDPGTLRLDGPNLNLSSTAQLISRVPEARDDGFEFCFGLVGGGTSDLNSRTKTAKVWMLNRWAVSRADIRNSASERGCPPLRKVEYLLWV